MWIWKENGFNPSFSLKTRWRPLVFDWFRTDNNFWLHSYYIQKKADKISHLTFFSCSISISERVLFITLKFELSSKWTNNPWELILYNIIYDSNILFVINDDLEIKSFIRRVQDLQTLTKRLSNATTVNSEEVSVIPVIYTV